MRSSFLLVFVLLACKVSFSQEIPLYYDSEFMNGYRESTLKNAQLKQKLYELVSEGHVKHGSSPDTIVANCASASGGHCEQHHPLGYDGARLKMFGNLYLKTLDGGQYSVKDVYCEKVFTDEDFKDKETFGPNKMPSSGNIINTEHTWPQSRFGGKLKDYQKSDLHHLFPTDSQMNATRSSLKFGNVVKEKEPLKCPQNHVGKPAQGGEDVFEVPDSQKGNTARAIFYFATRYQLKITPAEEAALREWDKRDPVDAEEYEMNGKIEELQGNRNPYIDFADLLDRIDKFQ